MALVAPMNGSCLINVISEASVLPSKKFEVIVESTPLVSIDLVVRAPDKKILLGKRVNRPAQGYWFVPGGRILKDESVKLTFKRLLDIELAIRPENILIRPLGIYQHFYPDNFSGDKFGTHYVVLAYEISLLNMPCSLPDIQHSDYKWFEQDELLQSDEVHDHTKWYFTRNRQADAFQL
jgi:colanic acid biosynthesis protein WcaH